MNDWISLFRRLFQAVNNFFAERFDDHSAGSEGVRFPSYEEYDPSDPDQINWLSFPLNDHDAEAHMMAVGTTGSGKTSVLRLTMQSVLPRVGEGRGIRAIVFDPKEDALPLIAGMAPQVKTITLNPFDDRGLAWAIHEDIDEPRYAIELARILIPESSEQNRFFSDAAREIVTGVIISFILNQAPWSLADIVRAVSEPALAKKVLQKYSHSEQYMRSYFHNEKQCADIFSTINSRLLEIRPVVSCWENARGEVSLKQFFQDEFIVVLGNAESSRATVQAINRLFFRRACDLVLAAPEGTPQRHWFFIDELGDAGRLEGLASLLKKGRSKGARVAISFQSISSLRNDKAFGTHETDEILGQIGNRFIGRIECPETAEWASRVVGDVEFVQKNVSYTQSDKNSTTTSYNHVTARAILPSEFMSLPICGRENGLTGVVSIRGIGCGFINLHPEDLFDYFLIPPDLNVQNFLPRSVECQYMAEWTPEQRAFFAPEANSEGTQANCVDPTIAESLKNTNLDDIL